jgi:hypothetical protein
MGKNWKSLSVEVALMIAGLLDTLKTERCTTGWKPVDGLKA